MLMSSVQDQIAEDTLLASCQTALTSGILQQASFSFQGGPLTILTHMDAYLLQSITQACIRWI